MDSTFLFAYGSLNPEYVECITGTYIKPVPVKVSGWKRVFVGHLASIAKVPHPSNDDFVCGLMYELNAEQLERIRNYEGFPHLYREHHFPTDASNFGKKFIAYIYNLPVDEDKLKRLSHPEPTESYRQSIVDTIKTSRRSLDTKRDIVLNVLNYKLEKVTEYVYDENGNAK
jgi:gamma-glutamylcyclotransferase (GGCT)/AIG2-like uncharacterized protein YtfP